MLKSADNIPEIKKCLYVCRCLKCLKQFNVHWFTLVVCGIPTCPFCYASETVIELGGLDYERD